MDIYEKISSFLETHNTANVIIAGQTCSGKTTLANRILNYFDGIYSVSIISQDDYFKNLCDIPIANNKYLMEIPEAFWIEEFLDDVHSLLQYGSVYMPNYDIASNSRKNKNKLIYSGQINIFEGLHTIEVLDSLENSISIFVDTSPDVCLKRRVERDSMNLGIPEKIIRQHWTDCIQPQSERFILPQKNFADIVFGR